LVSWWFSLERCTWAISSSSSSSSLLKMYTSLTSFHFVVVT
jgi:hypothetical protein